MAMACRHVRLRGFDSRPSLQFQWPRGRAGLMRRIYNPCERVRARSEGPNPSGAASTMLSSAYEGKTASREIEV